MKDQLNVSFVQHVSNTPADKFPGRLDWNQHYQILKGVSQALSYLHDEVRVIHGDINPSNVLLDDNFEPKLFDFGFSVCLPEGEDVILAKYTMGTP
jgi:serine/threonine protein kinase